MLTLCNAIFWLFPLPFEFQTLSSFYFPGNVLKIFVYLNKTLFPEPPYFVKKMEPKLTWKQGISARLQCSIKGSPELHIHWFWNERELSDQDKYKMSFKSGISTLEIMNLVVTDSGSYTCEVSNNAGSESCNTLVAVKGLLKKSLIGFTLTNHFRKPLVLPLYLPS